MTKESSRPQHSFSLDRAGEWFLESGIQERLGGVARYYDADLEENRPISTEITGYAISAFVYLHSLTGAERYREAATLAAHFLARVAWDRQLRAMPFEYSAATAQARPLSYFFDNGILVRGLLALWRVTRDPELLQAAKSCGESMAADFISPDRDYHPVLELPAKSAAPRLESWSHRPGCYQLKAALAWHELSEETGDGTFQGLYDGLLSQVLATHASFLPGDTDAAKVMDRLHAYCYFLEGLLPRTYRNDCAQTLGEGVLNLAEYLRTIGDTFARSDVFAQLLRLRILAEAAGVQPVDRLAAEWEANELAGFQIEHIDQRIHGGFAFGRRNGRVLLHINPVSTAFAVQALTMWRNYSAAPAGLEPRPGWQSLI